MSKTTAVKAQSPKAKRAKVSTRKATAFLRDLDSFFAFETTEQIQARKLKEGRELYEFVAAVRPGYPAWKKLSVGQQAYWSRTGVVAEQVEFVRRRRMPENPIAANSIGVWASAVNDSEHLEAHEYDYARNLQEAVRLKGDGHIPMVLRVIVYAQNRDLGEYCASMVSHRCESHCPACARQASEMANEIEKTSIEGLAARVEALEQAESGYEDSFGGRRFGNVDDSDWIPAPLQVVRGHDPWMPFAAEKHIPKKHKPRNRKTRKTRTR